MPSDQLLIVNTPSVKEKSTNIYSASENGNECPYAGKESLLKKQVWYNLRNKAWGGNSHAGDGLEHRTTV
jgi:hypothetical protein